MSKQTLVLVSGTAGAGKSALVHMMREGQAHLVECDLLRRVMATEWEFASVGMCTEPYKAGEPILPGLLETIGEHEYTLVEPCITREALAEEAISADFDVVHLWLVTPPFMTDQRRKYRVLAEGYGTPETLDETPSYAKLENVHLTQEDIDFCEASLGSRWGLIYLDTTDLPAVEVDEARAREIVAHKGIGEAVLAEHPPQYQQAVRIGDKWVGTTNQQRLAWEQQRLDAVLPKSMSNMDLLDVGAMEGGFCFEAYNRGARYCMAVDYLESAVSDLRALRDAFEVPITSAIVDVTTQSLPRLTPYGHEKRYSMGLLLNILHRVKDPGAVLKSVLEICDAVVIENPACEGTEPIRPPVGSGADYPGLWYIPPLWVAEVAHESSFLLKTVEVGPYAPHERKIFKLERIERVV